MGFLFRKKKVGPEYYLERGEECLEKGNYQWAVESFTKAIEFNPELEMAYFKRREAYKKLGKEREAVWDCIKFIEVDRRPPGTAEDPIGVLKESVKYARIGLQRDNVKSEIISFGIPKILDGMIDGYDPGKEYSDNHFYDLALSWLKEKAADGGHYVGFIKLLKREYDEALKELDKAIELSPEKPDPYYLKGVALTKKIRIMEKGARLQKAEESKKEARSVFEQALKAGYKGRICPGCGYRTSSTMNFCLRCGEKMLV